MHIQLIGKAYQSNLCGITADALINNGILPLEFVNEADYERIAQGDSLAIANIRDIIEKDGKIIVENKTKGESYEVKCELSERGKGMILAGGLLNMTKNG